MAFLTSLVLQSFAAQVVKAASKPEQTQQQAQTGQGGDSRTHAATKTYFGDVKTLVAPVRPYDAKTTGYRAKWDKQQARRLDELPTLHVDPQMLDYGVNVASVLRGNGVAIQTGSVNANGGVHGRGQLSGTTYGVATMATPTASADGPWLKWVAQPSDGHGRQIDR